MPLSLFLRIAAIVDILFGLAFLLVPALALAPLGVSLDASGLLMTRILGAALTAFAALYWSIRDEPPGAVLTAVLRAAALYNGVSAIPLLVGIVGGLTNALGWATFALHLFLTAGFVRFAVGRP